MVYYITPYCEGDIGKGLNEHISLLPDDVWICVRDQDTLLFDGAGRIIDSIVNTTDCDLIGAMTNRVREKKQLYNGRISNEADINVHVKIAKELFSLHYLVVEPAGFDLAGIFLLFKKSLWTDIGGFATKSIKFDRQFTREARRKGAKIGIAKGLYVFHLYRWGSSTPCDSINHLKSCM